MIMFRITLVNLWRKLTAPEWCSSAWHRGWITWPTTTTGLFTKSPYWHQCKQYRISSYSIPQLDTCHSMPHHKVANDVAMPCCAKTCHMSFYAIPLGNIIWSLACHAVPKHSICDNMPKYHDMPCGIACHAIPYHPVPWHGIQYRYAAG